MSGTVTCVLLAFLAAADVADELKTAHTHLQKGRYGEAAEVYAKLAKSDETDVAVPAILGLSASQAAEGGDDAALKTIQEGLKTHPDQPDLLARHAELLVQKGDYEAALKITDALSELDTPVVLARRVRGDALRELGRITEADQEYRWCVRYYNSRQPSDAASLVLLGQGAAWYARWHSVSQIYNFLVNTLCPDALKADPDSWEAYHLSGLLLLEKFNRAQGLPELRQALAINPRSAEVLAALGEASFQQLELKAAGEFAAQALAINPHNLSALHLQADLALRDADFKKAQEVLAIAQQVNPHDQRTLARVGLSWLLEDGWPTGAEVDAILPHLAQIRDVKLTKPSRFIGLIRDMALRNPRPGDFLQILGEQFERQLRFELAEKFYLAALQTVPQAPRPKASLGMLYLRMGRGEEARKLLDQAFEADPYHVRVSNMRKVLKLLEDYQTIATDHFVVRVDGQQDRILGVYLSRYLEEIYPALTKQFGYEPATRTQFEIYQQAKGVTAHQWFSARMVGLQWIQTIGASTGMIVALTSPTAEDQQFNWAKVVKHEFVHILTLQQTHFNCPHWFTEALATLSEEVPPPIVWVRVLKKRLAEDRLMTLQNINLGFQRPEGPDDWQLAYCQSQLYARYLLQTHGPDSLSRLLAAYQRGLQTPQAIREVCGVDVAEFERGYRSYLEQMAQKWQGLDEPPLPGLSELKQAFDKDPDNAHAAGILAWGVLLRRQAKEARRLAELAQAKDKKEPYSAVVLAELALAAGEADAAVKQLQGVFDAEHPQPLVLRKLAQAYVRQNDWAHAAELFTLATERDPYNPEWWRGLAGAYLKESQYDKAIPVLEKLAEVDFNDAAARKRLAQLAWDKMDAGGTIKYARQAMEIDVADPEIHSLLGQAYAVDKQASLAVEEFLFAISLAPDEPTYFKQLAEAHSSMSAEQQKAVRPQIEALLKEHPELKDLRSILEQ